MPSSKIAKLNRLGKSLKKCSESKCVKGTITRKEEIKMFGRCQSHIKLSNKNYVKKFESCVKKNDPRFYDKIKARNECEEVKCAKERTAFKKHFDKSFPKLSRMVKQQNKRYYP